MGVYLRWWANGLPGHESWHPDEQSARVAVVGRFPNASFGAWGSAEQSPSTYSRTEEQLLVWENETTHNKNADPVADLLRPR
jgi:hypothetical protein